MKPTTTRKASNANKISKPKTLKICSCLYCQAGTPTTEKAIQRCRIDGDYHAWLNGELLAANFRNELAAELALDEYKYELIEQGLITTETERQSDKLAAAA